MTLQSKCDLRFYRWQLWAPEERVNCPRSQSPGGCGAGAGEARALEDCRAKPPAPRFTFSLLIHPGHPPWELPNPGQKVPGYTAMTQIFTKIWLDFQVYFFCVWQKKLIFASENICNCWFTVSRFLWSLADPMQLVNGHEMQIGGWTSKSFCQRKGTGVEKGSREGRAKKLLRGGEIRPRTRERWGERGKLGPPRGDAEERTEWEVFHKTVSHATYDVVHLLPCLVLHLFSNIFTKDNHSTASAVHLCSTWNYSPSLRASTCTVGAASDGIHLCSSQNNRQRAPCKCLAPLLLLLLHSGCSGPHSLFPPPFLSVPCLSCF